MTRGSRLLAVVVLTVTVGCLALGWSAPAAAQAPGAITPPPEWADWDLNNDDQLTIDEFQQLSDADHETLQSWIDDTLDAFDDSDFRDWASEHFDFATGLLVDIPSPGVVDQVRDAPGEISDAVSGVVNDAASGVADSAFDAVASRVGEAAADLTGYIGEEMARTGRPQLEADWYTRHYQRMLGWAGLLLLPLAGLSIGGAVIRGDSAKVGHTIMQVPAVYLMGVLAISAVSAASGLAAAMSRSLVPGMQDASRDMGVRVTELMVVDRMAPGLVLLLGLVIAIAAIVTLLWLLLAEAAIYAVVLFVPLAFAGRVWEPAKDWGRKLLTIAFSLVAAKVVIFAIWALAVDGLAAASANDVPLRSALAVAALLLMTALAPTAALRLVPMLEGVERAGSPGGAARSAMSTAYHGAGLARMGSATLGSGRGGGGGGGLAVTGQIAGAAARAPTGTGGAGAGGRSTAGVPASRGGGRPQGDRQGGAGEGGRDPGRDGGRERGGDGTGRAAPSSGRPAGTGSRSGTGQRPEGPAAPASRPPGGTSISNEPPRAAPPALPPGTGGSGSPWRRREP